MSRSPETEKVPERIGIGPSLHPPPRNRSPAGPNPYVPSMGLDSASAPVVVPPDSLDDAEHETATTSIRNAVNAPSAEALCRSILCCSLADISRQYAFSHRGNAREITLLIE